MSKGEGARVGVRQHERGKGVGRGGVGLVGIAAEIGPHGSSPDPTVPDGTLAA